MAPSTSASPSARRGGSASPYRLVFIIAFLAVFSSAAFFLGVLGTHDGGSLHHHDDASSSKKKAIPRVVETEAALHYGEGRGISGDAAKSHIDGGPTHRPLHSRHQVSVAEHHREAAEEAEGTTAALQWRGTTCIAGGELSASTSAKLLSNCAKGRVDKQWCEAVRAAGGKQTLCGQYVAGEWDKARSGGLSSASLEAVRHALVDKVSASKAKGHQCNSPKTFGSVVEGGMVALEPSSFPSDGGLRLHSHVCEGFAYVPHGASIASILHYHSAVRGAAVRQEGGDAAGSTTSRRGILFTGDSMTRQLFLHIIAGIRSDGRPMDHYFHSDALYILTDEGDSLIVLDGGYAGADAKTRAILRHWFSGYGGDREQSDSSSSSSSINSPPLNVLFAMLYLWDTVPATYRPEPFRMRALSLHVGSFMYWWNSKGKLEEVDGYLAAMGQHLAANSGQQFVHVTTPWTREDTFGGVIDSVRIPRNRRWAKWVDEEVYAAEKGDAKKGDGPRQRWLLDFAGIADANTRDAAQKDGSRDLIRKTPDKIHYMCIWLEKYPKRIVGMKDNGMGCKDPMNEALMQWLLALLLRT